MSKYAPEAVYIQIMLLEHIELRILLQIIHAPGAAAPGAKFWAKTLTEATLNSSVASPICQEGVKWKNLSSVGLFFLIFPLFPNFCLFFPISTSFFQFFPVGGGALCPSCPPAGYATDIEYNMHVTNLFMRFLIYSSLKYKRAWWNLTKISYLHS